MMEDLRERFFGPSFEHKSHDKVSGHCLLIFSFLGCAFGNRDI